MPCQQPILASLVGITPEFVSRSPGLATVPSSRSSCSWRTTYRSRQRLRCDSVDKCARFASTLIIIFLFACSSFITTNSNFLTLQLCESLNFSAGQSFPTFKMHAASLILGLVFATQFVFGLPAAVEGGMDKRFNGGNADLAAMVAYGGSALSSREPTEAEIANRAMYRRISGTGGS